MRCCYVVVLSGLFLICSNIIAADRRLRVAILDNFHYQKFVSARYKEFYMQGMELAKHQAKKEGIDIDYRLYQYEPASTERLSIRKQLPALLKWQPDVVIGPRDSNNFLLLKFFLKDVLVVSPFATSNDVAKMPPNFYSMTFPAKYSAQAMVDFVTKEYPQSAAFVISNSECKSCDDVSNDFVSLWKKVSRLPIIHHHFLPIDASSLDYKKLMEGYKKHDIIVLPNNAHETAIMMAMIDQVIPDEAIYVGGDGWGAWHDTEVGKVGKDKNYIAYHLVPWNIDVCRPEIQRFYDAYSSYFKKPPDDKLAYLSYQTIMSVITAIHDYHDPKAELTNTSVLAAYKKALHANPDWFRSTHYTVLKIHQGKISVYAVIDILNNKITLATDAGANLNQCKVN